jgi:hypothetical protein
MFFIVIPKCILINEELNGHIIIDNNKKTIKIMINNYSFYINDYLFYQINDRINNLTYCIYNYNQYRILPGLTINNRNTINASYYMKDYNNNITYTNNIIEISHKTTEPNSIIINAKECSYICEKKYFNTNKEFIIEDKIQTIPSFKIKSNIIDLTYNELVSELPNFMETLGTTENLQSDILLDKLPDFPDIFEF